MDCWFASLGRHDLRVGGLDEAKAGSNSCSVLDFTPFLLRNDNLLYGSLAEAWIVKDGP